MIAVDVLQYEELWRHFDFAEESWFPIVGPPKPAWDERRPTGELVKKLFDLGRFLPEQKPLPEPDDEAEWLSYSTTLRQNVTAR